MEAGGRLEIRSSQIPVALQLADWQSIPRAMRENLGSASIAFALRVVEPTFELPLRLVRHDAAKLVGPAKPACWPGNRLRNASISSPPPCPQTRGTLS